jgi:hypothetical protein
VIYPLIVDGHGRVKVKTNWYSAPLSPGWRAAAVVGPSEVEIGHDNRCAARHPRCYGHGHQILNLEHYLDVLEKKPGAMAGSTPLQQWRQAGRWPECLDRIWGQLEQGLGKSAGTREMITAGAGRKRVGMGPADSGRGRGVTFGRDRYSLCAGRIQRNDAVMPSGLSEELAEFERLRKRMENLCRGTAAARFLENLADRRLRSDLWTAELQFVKAPVLHAERGDLAAAAVQLGVRRSHRMRREEETSVRQEQSAMRRKYPVTCSLETLAPLTTSHGGSPHLTKSLLSSSSPTTIPSYLR